MMMLATVCGYDVDYDRVDDNVDGDADNDDNVVSLGFKA